MKPISIASVAIILLTLILSSAKGVEVVDYFPYYINGFTMNPANKLICIVARNNQRIVVSEVSIGIHSGGRVEDGELCTVILGRKENSSSWNPIAGYGETHCNDYMTLGSKLRETKIGNTLLNKAYRGRVGENVELSPAELNYFVNLSIRNSYKTGEYNQSSFRSCQIE